MLGFAACGHVGQICCWKMPGRQEGNCLETCSEFLPLQRQVMYSPSKWTLMWSPSPLGIVCLICLGKKPTQNVFLGEKKIKTAHKYLCHEAEKNFGSQLAYKRLQAPNQLSTWVYKKVKPLKKTMSSWSKRKGGNGVWEGRKIKFAPTWKRVGKRTCL